MRYSPKSWSRQAGVLCAALFAIALVCYVFSTVGIGLTLPLQIITLVCMCGAIYILVRYRFTVTAYIVRQREDAGEDVYSDPAQKLDFCVARGQGRRAETLECVLGLECLVDVFDPADRGMSDVREKYKGIKIYDYRAGLAPKKKLGLIFDDGAELCCVIIEPDRRLEKFLKDTLRENGAESSEPGLYN